MTARAIRGCLCAGERPESAENHTGIVESKAIGSFRRDSKGFERVSDWIVETSGWFRFVSPLVIKSADSCSGITDGLCALRGYWEKGLQIGMHCCGGVPL